MESNVSQKDLRRQTSGVGSLKKIPPWENAAEIMFGI